MPIDRSKQVQNKKTSMKRKKIENDDDDSDNNNSTSDNSDTDENDTPTPKEYQKLLSKMFPSKYMDKKIKASEKLKKALKNKKTNDSSSSSSGSEEEDEEEEENVIVAKKSKKTVAKEKKKEKGKEKGKKNTKSRKKNVVETSSSSEEEEEEVELKKKSTRKKKTLETFSEEEEDDYDEDSDDEDEYFDEEDEEDQKVKKSNKFNIIFTIGGTGEEEEWETDDDDEDWEEDDTSDYDDTENEDDDVSSSSSSSSGYDEPKKQKKEKEKTKEKEKEREKEKEKDTEKEEESIDDPLLLQLKELYEKNKQSKTIQKCIDICEKDRVQNKKKQEKKQKKQKLKNGRIFKKIIRDKNTMNDFSFFQKMETEDQKKVIKELREINKIIRVEKPYRLTLLESSMPTLFKATAMKKISTLRYMEPGSGEFYKIKNWVDTFMRMPFNQYLTLPINISDGVEKCHEFMANSQKTLNDAVYGLNDAKMQIMQMLGQLVTNPKSIGTAIAIHGPAGTGKTSIVKEGISKILNRPFAFIALGGATDSSFLEGHSYTYEGSTWGKIVQILIDSKCMNPVIYFDELDKISDTPKGEEITGILTHLTDTSQNSQFHDKYFSEIDFDLSKCLFIFSYNDESKINPILKDRMYRIQTKGYNQKQKTIISNNYLLPKIREQVVFDSTDVVIPDDTLHYIIENFCNKEDGVRNLKRCLEIIHTKLNLYRLMKPGSNLFEEDMMLDVTFPLTVNRTIVDKLIKREINNSLHNLYI
jgi:ATP-dependent Lon protease